MINGDQSSVLRFTNSEFKSMAYLQGRDLIERLDVLIDVKTDVVDFSKILPQFALISLPFVFN